jgi:hypothetical protein
MHCAPRPVSDRHDVPMPRAGIARFARRLAARWQQGCWTGLVVRVIPAQERDENGVRVRTPDHFLGAAWPPASEAPSRWPEVVVIGSPSADNALSELFVHLPADARVFLASIDDVDAALAARILLAADRNLEQYQRDALDAFIAAERARVDAAITSGYTDCDPGFLRFRDRLLER